MPPLFYRVDDYPDEINAAGILVRLIDGLGFRFFWATDGLGESDYDYAPEQGGNSLGWMVAHIWGLTNWVRINLTGERASRPRSIPEQRDHVLEMLCGLREHFSRLSAIELSRIKIEGYPFWHMINGPIADALTHVGQINYARRLAGAPVSTANVFTCDPPEDPI